MNALSAGEEIRKILRREPEAGKREYTPLFRKQGTGEEVMYEESRACMEREMRRAEIYQDGLSPHSLRVGGATAYGNSTDGGELVEEYMGL